MGRLLEVIGDGMIAACGVIILLILIPIALFGEVVCFEDNPAILITEIVLGFVIIALGIERGIRDFKETLK